MRHTLKSPSITSPNSANFTGSTKNAGTKYIFPFSSGFPANCVAHPLGTLLWPNVHVSPAKVETKARVSYCSWLGWGALVLTRVRRAWASVGEAQGRAL